MEIISKWPINFENYKSCLKWINEELTINQYKKFNDSLSTYDAYLISSLIGYNCSKMTFSELANKIDITEYALGDRLKNSVKTMARIQKKKLFRDSLTTNQQLEAAFKAGWMRANATNYDDSYFQHFLSENYDNH